MKRHAAEHPALTYLGPSSDGRTNRWRVACVCGKSFEPPTTRLSTQSVECPKCDARFTCDYNATIASIVRSAEP